jgi:hypothetical protein
MFCLHAGLDARRFDVLIGPDDAQVDLRARRSEAPAIHGVTELDPPDGSTPGMVCLRASDGPDLENSRHKKGNS